MKSQISSDVLTSARKYIRRRLTNEYVNELWCDFWPKSASVKTTTRWMSKGPDTKNTNFEPFLVQLATSLGWTEPKEKEKVLSINDKLVLLINNITSIHTNNDRATIKGIHAFFTEQPRLSNRQIELVNLMYNRYQTIL